MAGIKPKTHQNQFIDTNPVESFRDVAGGVKDSFGSDLIQDGISDLWEQLLGGSVKSEHKNTSGELSEGEEIDFSKHSQKKQQEQQPSFDVDPGYNYRQEILHAEKTAEVKTERFIEAQVQEIFGELKRLIATSAQMEVTFKEVVSEQRIKKVGKYHVSFFSFVLTLVRQARVKIEDSGAWLNAVKSKKGQKQYWNMFKKHGTSFGMSNERSVATQVG